MRAKFRILLVIIFLLSGCGSPSDPDVPDTTSHFKILDKIKTRGQPLSLDINDDNLYVADNRNGLVILDISNPAGLSIEQAVDTPERATVVNVEARMNALFISTNLQTYIYFLNTLTCHQSSIIGDADCRQILTDVEAGSETIRVIKADGNDGVQVSNVFEDLNDDNELYFQKEDMKSLNWSSFIPPSGLAVIDGINILAVGLRDMGVGIADVTDATANDAGIWISNVDTQGEVSDVDYAGGYVYAANGYFGLTIIDVSDINNPEVIKTIPTEDNIHINKVDVFQNHLVLLDEYKGLLFYDITIPDKPVLKGEYELREPYDTVFDSSDGLLYVSSLGEGITVFQLDY